MGTGKEARDLQLWTCGVVGKKERLGLRCGESCVRVKNGLAVTNTMSAWFGAGGAFSVGRLHFHSTLVWGYLG